MKLKKVLEENSKLLVIIALITALILVVFLPIIKNNTATPEIGYSITNSSIMQVVHESSGATLSLEVASTEQKRETGLMFRDALAPNTGMIFIFAAENDLSFWMKNTSISLDMIFLDKDLKVTSVSNDAKILQTTEFYNSKSPSQFVIETLAGWAHQNNVKEGDSFKIESVK